MFPISSCAITAILQQKRNLQQQRNLQQRNLQQQNLQQYEMFFFVKYDQNGILGSLNHFEE